jgi:hypothetical protein
MIDGHSGSLNSNPITLTSWHLENIHYSGQLNTVPMPNRAQGGICLTVSVKYCHTLSKIINF